MKTKILSTALLALFFVLPASAQPINKVLLSQKVDSLITLQYPDNAPGGAIAIISGNEVLLKKTFGLSDIDQNTPVDNNTVFNLASVSKQFTAFAILMLEAEGKIKLDADIHTYLPDMPRYEHKITVRNLLQHTNGLASTDVLRLCANQSFESIWTQSQELEMIKSYPHLNFEPNTEHLYSNSGYSLLAAMIESVSGLSYTSFLRQNIFAPVGMQTAVVFDNEKITRQNLAIGYKKVDTVFVSTSTSNDFSYGASNIFASLNDMIEWGKNFKTLAVGSKAMIEKMYHPYNTLNNGDTISYTYGFYSRINKGQRRVEHSGGTPGYRSHIAIFPGEDLIIITLGNTESMRTTGLTSQLADLALAGKLAEKAPAPRIAKDIDPEMIKIFEGSYQMADGSELTFKAEKDTFWLYIPDGTRFQLYAESEKKFFLKAFDAQCSFIVSPDGKVEKAIWHQNREYDMIRTGTQLPMPQSPDKYAGIYYQADLKIPYSVTYEDEKLILHTPQTFQTYLGIDKVELKHVNGDMFSTDSMGMVEFTRNENGISNGLILRDIGRIRNIRFLRQ